MTIKIIPEGTDTPTAATVNITSASIDTDKLQFRIGTMAVQVNTVGLNSADSVLKVQQSNDDTNYEDITDASVTMASGTDSQMIAPIIQLSARFYKFVYTKNTNSAGTIQVIINFI